MKTVNYRLFNLTQSCPLLAIRKNSGLDLAMTSLLGFYGVKCPLFSMFVSTKMIVSSLNKSSVLLTLAYNLLQYVEIVFLSSST